MIERLLIIDFDSTLAISPEPEKGKIQWEDYYGKQYPHVGWWSKPESLDNNVFDIKLNKNIENILREGINCSRTYTIILTSRLKKLKPEIERILELYNLNVNKVDLKSDNKNKGEKILNYLIEFPNITQIDVFDDNYEREILSFKSISNEIPNNITYNIYHVQNGNINVVNEEYVKKDVLVEIIVNEINNLF